MSKRLALPMAALTLVVALAGIAFPARALFDPSKEYVESPPVAARYKDPDVDIPTPAFRRGKTDFTNQDELLGFIDDLARRAPDVRVRGAGLSQESRAIPLLVFSRPAASSGGDLIRNGKPTVLIIGQQHGNEPAGGEAALALAMKLGAGERAGILDHINVLIVPRANPDGAFHFVRGLKNGGDVNRDHLLGNTPEGQALGRVFVEYQPDVVLDCHEFGVKLRWYEKFQALQGYDALIQYATVPNLPQALTDASEALFRMPLLQALERAGLRHSWYYTTAYDVNDRQVSMGGVVPDTGRNIAGLRNAISFLIETRGVGIGRAHFKRRVHTHLVAMESILDSTAGQGPALLALGRAVRKDVAEAAGKGVIVVSGIAALGKQRLEMIDAESGADKPVEVQWRSALEIEARLIRARPAGYLLAGTQTAAAAHLRALGVSVLRLRDDAQFKGERYRIVATQDAKKDDVRRNDEEGSADIVKVTTETESTELSAVAGAFYVPLDQPLANLVIAALEPEPQSSYVSNRLVTLP
ncbi:MAG: M14 family metallocarboxypeptidase, partial [Betaproteobacteria bacterium]